MLLTMSSRPIMCSHVHQLREREGWGHVCAQVGSSVMVPTSPCAVLGAGVGVFEPLLVTGGGGGDLRPLSGGGGGGFLLGVGRVGGGDLFGLGAFLRCGMTV